MDELIERIKNYIAANAQNKPDVSDEFPPELMSVIKRMEERYRNKAPAWSPVSLVEVEKAEVLLGFRLPPLLRELYLKVGNGGPGPAYGILGLNDNGWATDQGVNAVDMYLWLRKSLEDYGRSEAYEDDWREGLLPICYGGGLVYVLLDCTIENGPVWAYDDMTIYPEPVTATLEEWLECWLRGDLD